MKRFHSCNFKIYTGLLLLLIFIFVSFVINSLVISKNEFKILHITHIMKNDDKTKLIYIDDGINEAFRDYSVKYNYKVSYYNKISASENSQKIRFEKLTSLLDNYSPDVVIVSGDAILEEIALYSKQSDKFFVFIDLDKKTQLGANSTAIIKKLPAEKLVNIIDYLKINKEKIIILSDNSYENDEIYKKLNRNFNKQIKHIKVDTFNKWSEIIKNNKDNAELYIILNIFEIKNELGKLIIPSDIIKWKVKNSKIPEIGFDNIVAENGGLGTLYISNYSKGYLAASKAIQILFKTQPSQIPLESPRLTILMLNKKRAKQLNVIIDEKYMKNTLNIDVMKR